MTIRQSFLVVNEEKDDKWFVMFWQCYHVKTVTNTKAFVPPAATFND